jgi:hypothetical protein
MIRSEQQRQQQSAGEDEIFEDRHEHPRSRPMKQDAALTGKTCNRSKRIMSGGSHQDNCCIDTPGQNWNFIDTRVVVGKKM